MTLPWTRHHLMPLLLSGFSGKKVPMGQPPLSLHMLTSCLVPSSRTFPLVTVAVSREHPV